MTKRVQLPYDQTLEFLGHKLNYQVLGKGKPVLILHGALTSRNWGSFTKEISKHYKSYFLELPGFGASDNISDKKHDIELFAEALSHFLQESNLKKAPIIASSLGTVVAVAAAAKGDNQGKLILVGAPGPMKGKMFKLLSKIPSPVKRFLVQGFARSDFVRRKLILPIQKSNLGHRDAPKDDKTFLEELSHTHPASIVDINYHNLHNKLANHLPNLKNQVYFLYGEEDQQKEGTRNLANNPIIIPDSGHNIFAHNPEALVSQIRKILA